jgi:polar amino acid transport system substrate-binding protein
VTVPYHQFREVLTVREADAARFRTLADLRGRRVATLSATLAYDLLTKAQAESGVIPVTYDEDVHPYSDLALGRIDAVLLDDVIAARRVRQNPGLISQPAEVGVGYYVGILAPTNTALRDRVDEILKQAMRDGRLEAIFRKWKMWNDDQPRLYARLTGGAPEVSEGTAISSTATVPGQTTAPGPWEAVTRYLPALLNAALITLGLSCVSMALAVAVGVLMASGRVYGPTPVRLALTAWVEMIRGTPLLLQLFVLYYGLATVVQLPAMFAAFLGLGLNYAAYESEIYRGALEAIPAGQLDAARALGFSQRQTLLLIRGPQAFRLALPAMTNDFVALLKDSSLVSVITVVELTKQTSIFANNVGSWVVPGAVCAALYLALSLPIAHAARRLENGWSRKLV